MKELIREYQSITITSISCMFVFICVYTLLSGIINDAVKNKNIDSPIEFIGENAETYPIKLNYPKGDKIKLIKGAEFDISDYITIQDKEKGEISNYSYSINVNGKDVDTFGTETCGGYYICADIIYNNTKMQGDLLVIIEER